MAITKCRECGGQVSTKAAACPHCGATNPAVEAAQANANNAVPPKKKSSTLKTVLIVIAVLWVIGTVAQLSAKRSTTQSTARSEPVAGLCNKQPLEIFPVGEKFESDALSKRTDANCPNARFHADERIEVSYGGQRFFVQTKKLNFSGPAYYEIVSIRAADR
jgi:hypothetical protein